MNTSMNTNMNTYTVKGYFDSNPSVTLTLPGIDFPDIDTVMDAIIAITPKDTDAYTLFDNADLSSCSGDERPDLRDNDNQRVYVLYLDAHFLTDFDALPKACKDGACNCETTDFLVTIELDVEGK